MAEQRHPLDTPVSKETAEIKGEIARTRVEMSETLGEIQDRLRPDHLLQQAKDGVTNAAAGKVRTMMYSAREGASVVATRTRDAGTYLADYATAHPIRIALTIGAVTWWMLRGRERVNVWDGIAETRWDDESPNAVGLDGDIDSGFGSSARRPLRDKVGEYASTVGEYAATARETVGEYASSARDTVGEYAASARTSAQRASARVGGAARSAGSSVDDFARENPLAAGAIALAIGAAIGMMAPRTALEDSAMGETRDRAWEKASRAASNIKDTVAEKMAAAAENLVGESLNKAASATPVDPFGRA